MKPIFALLSIAILTSVLLTNDAHAENIECSAVEGGSERAIELERNMAGERYTLTVRERRDGGIFEQIISNNLLCVPDGPGTARCLDEARDLRMIVHGAICTVELKDPQVPAE